MPPSRLPAPNARHRRCDSPRFLSLACAAYAESRSDELSFASRLLFYRASRLPPGQHGRFGAPLRPMFHDVGFRIIHRQVFAMRTRSISASISAALRLIAASRRCIDFVVLPADAMPDALF